MPELPAAESDTRTSFGAGLSSAPCRANNEVYGFDGCVVELSFSFRVKGSRCWLQGWHFDGLSLRLAQRKLQEIYGAVATLEFGIYQGRPMAPLIEPLRSLVVGL